MSRPWIAPSLPPHELLLLAATTASQQQQQQQLQLPLCGNGLEEIPTVLPPLQAPASPRHRDALSTTDACMVSLLNKRIRLF